MRYASASAFRTALEARLLEHSRQTGLTLVRLRKSVVFARLLARLLAVAPDRWVLKGGLALDYRFGSGVRTTKDMDFAQLDGEEAATENLNAAQTLDLGDFFTYEIERSAQIDDMEGGQAVRFHARCLLAGRVFDEVLVDVGFDLPPGWEPDVTRGPSLLGFADIDAVDTPTLPLELQVAEKVHAYTRSYGRAGMPSSRVKDLIDLVLISKEATLDAGTLGRALRDTFGLRGQHPMPDRLLDPPKAWITSYARLATEVGLAPDLSDGFGAASALLDPVLSGLVTVGGWDPAPGIWSLRPHTG